MPLINIKDPSRMPIKYLWQLIYTFTFDKKSCGHMTKDIISQQLCKWNGFIQINKEREANLYGLDPHAPAAPIGMKGSVLDEIEYQLQNMCWWVVKEEQGKFEAKADLYKKHKIDFRLVKPYCEVFPEYATRRNMNKGAAALKQAMIDNPEDYDDPNDPNKRPKYFTGN